MEFTMNINIGDRLVFKRNAFDRSNNALVLDRALRADGSLFAVKVKTSGHPFWVRPEELFPVPVEPRSADPDGFSAAERRLFDVVTGHGPLLTSAIAAIVNGDPAQVKKWTASTAGMLARRLTDPAGRLKMKRVGKVYEVSIPK